MKTGPFLPLLASFTLAATTGVATAAEPPSPRPPARAETGPPAFRDIAPPLPAGTYYAVTRDGVRLSGIIASAGDTSFSRMPTTRSLPRYAQPRPRTRVINPALRFERR